MKYALLFLVACGSSTKREEAAPPPPALSGPDACKASGGTCVGVGECGASAGHLGATSCSVSVACCFMPATSCGGVEDFMCCSAGAEFRPMCKAGALVCGEGQTRSTGPRCAGM